MANLSAGILLYRRVTGGVEVLLVHPGGPLWAKKDEGAWSIPKGNLHPGEAEVAGARREFNEETGGVADGRAFELGRFRQPSGKVVVAFAVEGDFDLADFRSSTFEMEWPPRSKKMREFPEADRAAWFSPDVAAVKLLPGQAPMIPALLEHVLG
ncbi:MAG: NUDIX domain-containing protein [Bauldia sp.]|nr:NUDIX domain-containing protein [Bauldia sp.]